MIEQDYFMRMITMLTAALVRIFRLRKEKEYPQAILEIESTGKTLLGVDRMLIRQLSPSQLMMMFGSDMTVALPKSYVLAVLLKEEADVRTAMGDMEEADSLLPKSLSLLIDTLLKAGEPVEPRHTQLADEILAALHDRLSDPELEEKIFRYHEFMGRYDEAENTLFDLVATSPDYVGEGMQFYRRLIAKTDQELEDGGLPRGEVLEGIADLERKRGGAGR